MTALTLSTLVLIAGSKSFAMGRPLPQDIKDESLSDVSIQAPFNLRAMDGGVIAYAPALGSSASLDDLKYLPPMKGADMKKCGTAVDTQLLLSLTDIIIHSSDGPLSAADLALTQRIPRCEPYIQILSSLGAMQAPPAPAAPPVDVPSKLAIVKTQSGYAVQLTTLSGRQVEFQVDSKLTGVSSLKDLGAVRLDAASTGQNAGLQFSVSDPSTTDPTTSASWQSCTATETITHCDVRDPKTGKNKCETDFNTASGHRHVVSTSSMTTYDLQMVIVDAQNRPLMSASLEDVNFNDDDENSPCIADIGPIGPFGHDDRDRRP